MGTSNRLVMVLALSAILLFLGQLVLLLRMSQPREVPAGATPFVIGEMPKNANHVFWEERIEDYGEATTSLSQKSAAQGVGLTTSAGEVAQKFSAENSNTTLDGIAGGGFKFDGKLIGSGKQSPLMIVGIIAILLAGAAVYFKNVRLALILGVVGGLFIGASLMPGVFGIVALCAGIGTLLFCVFASDNFRLKLVEAMRAVTAGVEELPENTRMQVKKEIGKQATEEDRNTIRKIKSIDGFAPEKKETV